MRVISGSAKGKKLLTPGGVLVRPTADRMKEALFNMIAPDINECSFLDIFSGSGAIGIEALSRGAKSCAFIDNSLESLTVIEKNLTNTGLFGKAKIFRGDARIVLPRLNDKFNIVFMDPPYNQNYIASIVETVIQKHLLDEDGYIIAEHDTDEEIERMTGLDAFKTKDYRIAKLVFYRIDGRTSTRE